MAVDPVSLGFSTTLESDDQSGFGEILAAAKEGYKRVSDNETLPDVRQYTSFTTVSRNEIRFTYTDGSGNEQKRVVFKSSDPELFADVERANKVFNVTNASVDSFDAQLPKQDWTVPGYDDIEKITEVAYDDVKGFLVKVKGEDKPFLVMEERDPNHFKQLKDVQDLQNEVKGQEDEGYKLWSGPAPKLNDYGEFVTIGDDIIRFTLDDGSKHFVHKGVNEEAFNAIVEGREKFSARHGWVNQQNEGVNGDDPRFITFAGDDFQVPQQAWANVEQIPELGPDALLVTTFDNDSRSKKGEEIINSSKIKNRQVVLRDDVGDEKFNNLLEQSKHYDYLRALAPGGDNAPARLWEETKFDTFASSRAEITLGPHSVSWASDIFKDKGILIVSFNEHSKKWANQTIVFSRHHTPEAYDVIRKYVENADNAAGNLLPAAKPDRSSIEATFGKDVVEDILGPA
jgi:hypothetical protein